MAEQEIPRSQVLKIGEIFDGVFSIGMWISAPFVTRSLFDDFTGPMWLFVLGWTLLTPYAVMLATDRILAKPRRERKERIVAKIIDLAQDRKERLEERERFYSSPEWLALRAQVIEEDGQVCADCGKKIRGDNDLTVDHKQPRSRSPELALRRENLRVLCRRCNSRKGATEWLEV
ncbi:MAG: HNH endonuclease [Chloroflexi bacterium]|nr:HNH endonuclease [Chloroflexota bacterium]